MKLQRGLTLLEIMLVLAIIATIFILGLRQYQSYRIDSDIQQFNYDIDQLFQAMTKFYFAECGPVYDTTKTPPTVTGKKLFKFAMDNLTKPYLPYPIDIDDDLVVNNYLDAAPSVDHPFVSNYIVQFNEYTQPRTICTASDAKDCPTNQKQMGTIILWKIQVAVEIRDPTQMDFYKNLLIANCISDADKGGTTVTPCSTSTNKGNYLVYERLPMSASPNAASGYELMTPLLKQFKQMYTTNPMTNLTGTSHSSEYQYFNCGT